MQSEVSFYVNAVLGRKKELEESVWLTAALRQLEGCVTDVERIRCLALGSVSDFVSPRFQLAFLLIVADKLGAKSISAWDPVFTPADKGVLAHFGIEVEEADPPPAQSLLWYVPHGPFGLVLDLPSKIGHNVYIGNDLSSFKLDGKDPGQRKVIEEYKSNARIIPLETSRRDRWFLAFSSTAIHMRSRD